MKYEMILLAILTQFALFPSVARPQVLPQDPATQGRVVSASPEKQLPDEMAPDSSLDFVLGEQCPECVTILWIQIETVTRVAGLREGRLVAEDEDKGFVGSF